MNYITVIGLEIHAELLTRTKLFCSCENTFGGQKNTRVCPVCTGQPGSLPMLNKQAVVLAAKAGFCLDSKVHSLFSFDRKNYFYPDLPKAYQISQLYNPICTGGNIGKIRINNIHLEEDAGKLIHSDKYSEIDLNRCGVPLIEIVTEPDFRNADEVCEFLSELSRRLKYADICDCKMEQGSIRTDINISLMPEYSKKYGVRTELKNINSFRSIKRAIAYEIQRQRSILEKGGKITAETRRFDEKTGTTVSMRSKESDTDYRYFPEPDIPPIKISDSELKKIKLSLPEMPNKRFLRYITVFNLKESDAALITENKSFSDFFEACISHFNNPSETAKLMLSELNRLLKLADDATIPVSPEAFSELIRLFCEDKITKNEQKEILKLMFKTGKNPHILLKEIKKEIPSAVISDKIHALISEHPSLVSEYKKGSSKCIDFFLGQLMRTFGKSLNPHQCRKLIISALDKI